MAERIIEGGVDLIQLRGKDVSMRALTALAGQLHQITWQAGIPFIVNDHPQIAAEVPVEGVHLGQDDGPVAAARKTVGREVVIGRSTHSLDQARAAQAEGADYIGFGPIFATPTKPDYAAIGLTDIKEVHRAAELPVFCIGGIKLGNLSKVIAAGARRVVIVSGLLEARDVVEYASACKELLCDAALA